MATKRILLDPGHYGPKYNAGAVAGYYESAIVFKLTMYEKEYLEAMGIEVGLTRTNINENPELTARGKMAKGYDLFVSNHTNACSTPSVTKASVIYLVNNVKTDIDERSQAFAVMMAETLISAMPIEYAQTYSRLSDADRDKNGKLDDNYYGVLHGAYLAGTPGAIIEHSFHTNPDICRWLMDDNNLRSLAKACATCMAKYVGANKAYEEPKVNNTVEEPKVNPTPATKKDTTNTAYPAVPFKVEVLVNDLNYRSKPSMEGRVIGQTRKGIFTIVEISNGWGKLKSGTGWIWLGNSEYCRIKETVSDLPYVVKVDIDDLNIRTGPGTIYTKTGEKTGRGKFTITEVKEGPGSDTGWGKLKSGAGWISLDFAKRI